MPLIETKGAASAQGFGLTLSSNTSGAVTYIEDVFSTYLYTGNGSTQTITNGIDLSGKGGLVWTKKRNSASSSYHTLIDTLRGTGSWLRTDGNVAAISSSDTITSFNASGYALGTGASYGATNTNSDTYVSWTFREQPKFFDVVTYTGDGASSQVINHSLNSVPGGILIKRLDSTSNWPFWRLDSSGNYRDGWLNLTDQSYNTVDASTLGLTSTTFNAGKITQYDGFGGNYNANGATYVAYLFAHNAGGFGLTGTDNVISCGYAAGGTTVNLGYEPQWVLTKNPNSVSNWLLVDNMRGMPAVGGGAAKGLLPNTSGAESDWGGYVQPTSTGFYNGVDAIYIAIRRGPMKVPTSGTSVFGLSARTGTGANATVTGSAGVSDAVLIKNRGSAVGDLFASRLTGTGYLETSSTAAEVAAGTTILQANPWDVMDGVNVGTTSTITNASSNTFINYLFRRAPGFFDEVCYTGTGSNTTQTHNLGVVPELIIVKRRDTTGAWDTYSAALSNTEYLVVNTTAAKATGATRWNSTTPTSTLFSLGTSTTTNASGGTYVAYLFATCAGVSKVGTYTGTGALQTINCGFTGGARFVLIKRTDSTGDWYVYDSARGISSGNDPYLLLNDAAAEVTGTNYVDTTSVGFQVTAAAPAGLNASGGSFVFLAIA